MPTEIDYTKDYFYVCEPVEIPKCGIYSIVAIKIEINKIGDFDTIMDEIANELNTLNCEGAHLFMIRGVNGFPEIINGTHILYVFAQYWG